MDAPATSSQRSAHFLFLPVHESCLLAVQQAKPTQACLTHLLRDFISVFEDECVAGPVLHPSKVWEDVILAGILCVGEWGKNH